MEKIFSETENIRNILRCTKDSFAFLVFSDDNKTCGDL